MDSLQTRYWNNSIATAYVTKGREHAVDSIASVSVYSSYLFKYSMSTSRKQTTFFFSQNRVCFFDELKIFFLKKILQNIDKIYLFLTEKYTI